MRRMRRMLTAGQVCERLGITPNTLRSYRDAKVLVAIRWRPGRGWWRYDAADVAALERDMERSDALNLPGGAAANSAGSRS